MVVAAFASASAAEAAVEDLDRARIPSAVSRSYTKDASEYADYRARESGRQGGFWSWLLGEESSQTSEYGAYDTSLAAGHTVVTVTVDDVQADAVVGILNQHGPHDIHEQAAGASGAGPSSTHASSTAASSATTDRAGDVTPTTATSGMATGKEEEVIPLAEEELQVGKRTVDRGTTTIRRFVVRTPVEERITLRDETVSVERRRPVTAAEPGVPAGAFEERTVEVHQTEEPVVAKTARVAEEVVVRKDVDERTETVRDNVRREEVDIQDPNRRSPL